MVPQKSDPTLDQLLSQERILRRIHVGLSAVFALLLPGLGYVYLRQYWLGLGVLLGFMAAGGAYVVLGMVGQGAESIAPVLLLLAAVIWLFSAFNTVSRAQTDN